MDRFERDLDCHFPRLEFDLGSRSTGGKAGAGSEPPQGDWVQVKTASGSELIGN